MKEFSLEFLESFFTRDRDLLRKFPPDEQLKIMGMSHTKIIRTWRSDKSGKTIKDYRTIKNYRNVSDKI